MECWCILQQIIVYLIRKLDKKPIVLTFGQIRPLSHIRQVNLNMSNLTSGVFTDHKMVFLTSQIEQKIG
jgi:hypothetical protein